jgi:HisJ family histidinol phosphate phosphatase
MHPIFSKIDKEWEYDLHVHTNWSQDIAFNGPNPQDYIELAQKYHIHIGFLDHFELLREKEAQWKLNLNTIDSYLNQMEELKKKYNFITTGLEIDYYTELEDKIEDFIENYGHRFDFLVGTMHETDLFYPVTQKDKLQALIKKYGSFEAVVERYFEKLSRMIHSGLFKAIAHPDVIYRFCSKDYFNNKELNIDKKVIEVLKPCISNNILIELNISGLYFEIGRPFPSQNVVNHLLAEGATFFVGSDSHSTKDFEKRIIDLRKAHYLLRK